MGVFKKSILLIVCFLTILYTISPSSLEARKSASIVICAETGKVYSSHNPDVITYPASLTKMMTLYLTFQALREGKINFDTKLRVSKRATQQEPGNLWLKQGSFITVRQAILGLVTKSANDASVVLAEALGGSEPQFAIKMTQKARQLGMMKTVFKNASGLPNKNQVTTARDMATLSRALYLHFREYYKFFKVREFDFKGTVHKNHNHLLGKVEGVDGIKTGFINASGFNLAASMVRYNRRIIAVVLGGESIKARDKKMAYLLEATHASLKGKPVFRKKSTNESIGDLIHTLSPTENSRVPLYPEKAVYLSKKGKMRSLTKKYDSLDDLFAGVIKPASLGKKKIKKAKATPVKKNKKIKKNKKVKKKKK